MNKWAYYNEIDPFAAAWLRKLIEAGHVADGEVDERDIRDVHPADLRGFAQVHMFAGIGGWSRALRLADWGDDRPVWTGSCPCQPFSQAGRGGGVADERHLWPHFHHLINECRPGRVYGEQVSSPDGLAWFDLVQTDLEGSGYAAAALDICAASVGAPHIRQRLYWVGISDSDGWQPREFAAESTRHGNTVESASGFDWLADAESGGRGEHGVLSQTIGGRQDTGQFELFGAVGGLADANEMRRTGIAWNQSAFGIDSSCAVGALAVANGGNTVSERIQRSGQQRQQPQDSGFSRLGHPAEQGPQGQQDRRVDVCGQGGSSVERASGESVGRVEDGRRPSPTNGFWADWLFCRDGKWRPVEPDTFVLASGVPNRMGLLRGFGNAIVPPLAAEFIKATM